MATVNLGSLRFDWKGAYNGSTPYAVDDVVSYNGSSYICILASTGNLPTNTTYFQPMATAGTDLSTTLTTQGDIVYRDASGLQRLAAGTSGFSLITKGAGQNPVWESASANFARQIKYVQQSSAINFSSTSHSDTGLSLTFDNNLKSTNSIVKITFNALWGTTNNPENIRVRYKDAAGNKITNVIGNPDDHFGGSENTSSNYSQLASSICFATVSSTTPIAYRPYVRRVKNNGHNGYFGRNHDDGHSYATLFMIEEYAI